LGTALAAQYLGGYPMYCLFSAYLMGLYVLWSVASEWRALSRQSLAASAAALACAGLIAGLLALPQLLPALELARLSPRPLGGMTLQMIDPGYTPGWLLPLQTLAGTLLPTRDSVFSSGFAPHVGTVGLALAAIGVAVPRRRGIAMFFVGITVVSALLALGRHTPLYALYFKLPTADWFRGPNRFFVLTTLGLAMLAGCGVDALSRERVGRKALLIFLATALVLAAAVSVLLRSASEQVTIVAQQLGGGAALPGATSLAGRLMWLRGYLLGAGAWLAVYTLWKPGRWLLVASLPVAAYASLFVSFINYAPLPDTNPDLHAMPPTVVQFLAAQQGFHRAYVLPWGAITPSSTLPATDSGKPEPPRPVAAKSGILNRLYLAGDRENVYPARFTEYVSRMIRPEDAERLDRLLARLGIPKEEGVPQGDFAVRADAPNLRLFDLLGIRFIVEGPQTNFQQQEAPDRFPLVYESDGVKVYRNASAYPRAFVATRADIISAPPQVLDRLTSPGFDPMVTVILEERPARLPTEDAAASPRSEVQFVRYAPDEVRLQVRTSTPGFVVLTDQYYSGWTAEVDSAPAAMHRADYLFRAVFVDAGDHQVVFRYQSRAFRVGVIGAGVGLALLALGLLADRRWRSRRGWSEHAPAA
jgi:hypothetical protein